jgi:subtilisin family serine protease
MRLLLIGVLAAVGVAATAQPRAVIRSEADLPPARIPLTRLPSEIFLGEDFGSRVLPQIRAGVERVLATSTIEDADLRSQLETGLAAIDLLENRPAEAERRIAAVRAAETKPQLRAIGWLTYEAVAAGLEQPMARCPAMAARITERLAGTNPEVVRDEILARLGNARIVSVAYATGALSSWADPIVSTQQSINLLDGLDIARTRMTAMMIVPCRDEIAAAWRAWIDDPAHRPADIWPERQPLAQTFAGARPVVVAIWDSGIDAALFPGQMAIDPAEPLDGRDNDGNGVVDDVHGPTYDYWMRPDAHSFPAPSDFLAPRLAFSNALSRGMTDLAFGRDTPEAWLAAERGRTATPAQQSEDLTAAAEVRDRGHGTFAASVVADGAPYVRLYNLRIGYGGYNPRRVRTAEAESNRLIAALPSIVRRMRRAGVRIVNMSWVESVDGNMRDLIETGEEHDPVRARARAQEIYDRERAAFAAAFAAAPDILWVASAGNRNQIDASAATLPQATAAPNLILVGATGQTGRPTAFTTYGAGIHIYARGEAVAGRSPGGHASFASGTSFSAPLVARTAAQMLAVSPGLTPAQLMRGLIQSATMVQGDQPLRLLHPAHAVEWARRQRRARAAPRSRPR